MLQARPRLIPRSALTFLLAGTIAIHAVDLSAAPAKNAPATRPAARTESDVRARLKTLVSVDVKEESVEAAVHAAVRNAQRNGITNVRFLLGEARPLLREWREAWTPEVAVVDPPRAGLHPRVVHHLARLAPQRLVYVSCHPGTLARDLALFVERGYAVERARPFDLFPHTPHIEVVARLVRRSD